MEAAAVAAVAAAVAAAHSASARAMSAESALEAFSNEAAQAGTRLEVLRDSSSI